MNRAIFYDSIRESLFWGRLTQAQVNGIEGLLNAFATHSDGLPDTLAYGLATAYHETGSRMVPVREGFARTDREARRRVARLARRRGAHSAVARYARPQPPFGHVYYGRGHVQLTWRENYRDSSEDAGRDLVRNPDAMLNPEISARVLWRGLLDGRWNAHGHGVRHYLDAGDPVEARRTVNILDKAETIAGYHGRFLEAIEAAS
ncbi:hypothetical protein DLJ49_18735 [Rhodovulum sp. 12E13]|uniref:glycoside hydrolase family 19 protein n=1 Tax=Rhodovulum sp. 12E13 TaxID=2203891 RepID=UPI000E14409A|nr:glycoside hydrolase family 19 protein [Rhodovulum sp. 12E13]RDC69676.1 hypothetical protein DLJ49_18735 [Rhodovulum sp. 12E13]